MMVGAGPRVIRREGRNPSLLEQMRGNRSIAAGLAALLIIVSSAAAHQPAPPPPDSSSSLAKRAFLPVIRLAPNFSLTSQTGRTVDLASLRGKVVLLDFFYASCPDICPLISGKMATLQGRLNRQGMLGKEVVLISASFDPAKDSQALLKQYAERMKADPDGWLFLRGDSSAIARILRDYDVWVRSNPDGSFDHSDRLYLIDRNGRIREIYNYRFFTVEQTLLDIQSLLERTPGP